MFFKGSKKLKPNRSQENLIIKQAKSRNIQFLV
jgi:hypothetical protein